MAKERPLSHWVAVARMGFERDFQRIFRELGITQTALAERIGTSAAYVSKVLNGKAKNFQLETMAKLARAVGASVQISLVRDGRETVRVVDYDTAALLDGVADEARHAARRAATSEADTTGEEVGSAAGNVVNMDSYRLRTVEVSTGAAAHG